MSKEAIGARPGRYGKAPLPAHAGTFTSQRIGDGRQRALGWVLKMTVEHHPLVLYLASTRLRPAAAMDDQSFNGPMSTNVEKLPKLQRDVATMRAKVRRSVASPLQLHLRVRVGDLRADQGPNSANWIRVSLFNIDAQHATSIASIQNNLPRSALGVQQQLRRRRTSCLSELTVTERG